MINKMQISSEVKKIFKNTAYWLGVIVVGLIVGLGIQTVKAWTEPSAAPPNGNVAAPLNVGNVNQTKQAGLVINSSSTNAFGLVSNGKASFSGYVGVGTLSPAYPLDVNGTIFSDYYIRSGAWPGYGSGYGSIWYDGEGGSGSSSAYLSFDLNNGSTNRAGVLKLYQNGNVGIGMTPSEKLDVAGNIKASGDATVGGRINGFKIASDTYNNMDNTSGPWMMCQTDTTGGFQNSCGFRTAGGYAFSFGRAKNSPATLMAGAFQQISDERMKENIVEIQDAVGKLQSIRGVEFYLKKGSDQDREKGNLGVVAQEIESAFPQLVREDMDGYKMVDYSGFAGVFIEAIKEQQNEIDELEKRIEELEKLVK